MRPYLSTVSCVGSPSSLTVLPSSNWPARADASLPKHCTGRRGSEVSGVSMPSTRTVLTCPPSRTLKVSPSTTCTTGTPAPDGGGGRVVAAAVAGGVVVVGFVVGALVVVGAVAVGAVVVVARVVRVVVVVGAVVVVAAVVGVVVVVGLLVLPEWPHPDASAATTTTARIVRPNRGLAID